MRNVSTERYTYASSVSYFSHESEVADNIYGRFLTLQSWRSRFESEN